ncbi:GNAT family N-acetyltransferase [Streptomyces sp. NPDC048172]|uniref:GNAT family N-acetyltransferase n=1 Tax=Streptomyces sp. NPDC048172 TaxID=3365505 RepID=UPI0037151907
MEVDAAHERDLAGFLALAAQVEHWFGPMVDEPGFHEAVRAHVRRSSALVVRSRPGRPELLGALLFGAEPPTYHVHWLVVAEAGRGRGVGRALLAEAARRFVREPGVIEVVTFGADHPGAVASGARVFYERLGFAPAEPTDPGPEGGSRQIYRRTVDADSAVPLSEAWRYGRAP